MGDSLALMIGFFVGGLVASFVVYCLRGLIMTSMVKRNKLTNIAEYVIWKHNQKVGKEDGGNK